MFCLCVRFFVRQGPAPTLRLAASENGEFLAAVTVVFEMKEAQQGSTPGAALQPKLHQSSTQNAAALLTLLQSAVDTWGRVASTYYPTKIQGCH